MSITPSGYVKARSETLSLFGWSADSLSPDQTLRIDCAVALRLALDDLQGRIVRGESADVARMLTASEALARLLPPAVLAEPPAEEHGDPRQVMWEIYRQMRERGEVPPEGWHQHRINGLEAEVATLRAQLVDAGISPALPDVDIDAASDANAASNDATVIDPTEVVPPGEWRGEGYARPGPDDPAPRSAAIIEGKGVNTAHPPPPAAAAPAAYDYSANQDWKDWIEPDGSIRTTPRGRGKDWGPV
jgi:hypothetical protein